jgi:NCS1 family nucleobase:cation symporter-1
MSPRLYNEDIAPRQNQGSWRTWNLFAWWMSGWHSLAGYTMAIGLLVLGLTGWQMALGLVLGVVIIYFCSNLMGATGQRLGVPFPVLARISFGIYGANIPALMRAVVAIAWYGIQTYLASQAVMLLALKLVPAAGALTGQGFLGLSALGWICFLVLWTAQLIVLHHGMETVRRVSDFAGPTIWAAMLALAIWVLYRAHWTIAWGYHLGAPKGFWGASVATLAGAFLLCAYFSGVMLNFADFTRFSPDKASVIKGNRLGLLLNASAFCVVAVIIALASVRVYGKAINDPIRMLSDLDSVTLLLVSIISIGIATVGINIILNFVSPAFDFINAWPAKINFKRAGLITAVLALVVLPWKIFATPFIINIFIGGLGALMGPLLGIVLTDYYVIRRCRVRIEDLYRDDPEGPYYYSKGFNTNSITALATSGTLTLVLALVPSLSKWAAFSWPVGVVLGVASCLLVHLLRPEVNVGSRDRERASNVSSELASIK